MAFPRCQQEEFYQTEKDRIMNLNRILFTACFISISAVASAQHKGYYSIGNNAEKLKPVGDTRPADSFFRAGKGYYDIVMNRKKLRRSLEDNRVLRRFPQITKGYYSIGNNAERSDLPPFHSTWPRIR